MRSAAKLGLTVLLLAGASLLATSGTVGAQGEEELAFSSTCQQLRCFFEISDIPDELEGNTSDAEWTFEGNQTTKTGNPVEHTFPEPGSYEVTVVVEGNTSSANGTAGNATTATGSGQVTVSEGEVPWAAVGFGAVALVGSLALARMT